MRYQKDAHLYRKQIKRRQRTQRIKGVSFLVVALALAFYAVPCFATSTWDKGLPDQNPQTAFSTAINDTEFLGDIDTSVGVGAATAIEETEDIIESSRSAAKLDPSITETTGPGILTDDNAVQSAKKRAQAVSAAAAEKAAQESITVNRSAQTVQAVDTTSLIPAYASLFLAFVFTILGIRSIFKARRIRANFVFNSYSNALKA